MPLVGRKTLISILILMPVVVVMAMVVMMTMVMVMVEMVIVVVIFSFGIEGWLVGSEVEKISTSATNKIPVNQQLRQPLHRTRRGRSADNKWSAAGKKRRLVTVVAVVADGAGAEL